MTMITWKKNKNFKPDVVLQRLNGMKTITGASASLPAFDAVEGAAILMSMLDFGANLNEITKQKLLSRATHQTLLEENPKKEKLLENINLEYREFLNSRDINYNFLTSISVSSMPIRSINICGVKISFIEKSKNFPKKFSSRSLVIEQWQGTGEPTPSSYTKIIVSVNAKDEHDAATKALFAIDVIRAILCLLCNSSMKISFGNSRHRINTVMLGPIHTLHNTDGTASTEIFWYESDTHTKDVYTMPENQVLGIAKNIRWCVRKIKEIRYSYAICDSLARYVRAYDDNDSNTTVLHAWGALESLLSPHENNFDKAIKRCIFLYKERDYVKQVLEHLREYRNSNVHSGESLIDPKTHCYQMQFFFKNLIFFHLKNVKYFTSLEDANYFLDLPPDILLLNKRIKIFEKALRHLRED